MRPRSSPLRFLAGALLLFGLSFEAEHLRHHVEHAHNHDDHDHASHRACLVFHDGLQVEDVFEFEPGVAPVEFVAEVVHVRSSLAAAHRLPDPRAPPSV